MLNDVQLQQTTFLQKPNAASLMLSIMNITMGNKNRQKKNVGLLEEN